MSFSDVLFLYRARLRARTVFIQECFAMLGIAVGVALLFASQVASTSLSRSVTELSNEIVGNTQLQLDARSPGGFDEALLGQVRGIPGVKLALPVLEQQASVIGPAGERSIDLIGTDPRFARLAGSLLRRFSAAQIAAQQAIALPTPIAREIGVGSLQPAKLRVGANVMTTLIGATLDEGEIGALAHSPVALAPVGYAQRLTGMQGHITRIFIQTEPARTGAVRASLARLAAGAGVNVEPADFDSTLFRVAAAPQSEGEMLFSAISALVGFMLALNAMLITVPARRRLIDDIRLQGATRRMIAEVLLFDAAVIGVIACIVGLALGELLSVLVFNSTPGYLSFAFPVGNARIVTWQSVALSVCAGLAAATVGVLWPFRAVLWPARPGARARSAGDERHRRFAQPAAGVGFIGLTTLILFAYPRAAIIGNFSLIAALICLLPFLFDGLVTLFDHLQRPFNGASPVIAVTELRTSPSRVRSLAIAATGAVAVFGIVAVQGTQANLQRGLEASARGIDSSAAIWVSPKGEANAFATTPFTDVAAHTLTRLPGAGSVGAYRGSFLDWGSHRIWVLAPPQNALHPVFSEELVRGNLALAADRLRGGGWAIVSQGLASEHHLHVGERFTLTAPRPTSFRVAALVTNLGWPPGAVIVNSADYARAWGNGTPSAYEIEPAPHVAPATLRATVAHALAGYPGLAVETAAEREQRHYSLARQGLSRLTQIRLLVLIAAVLAIAGAMGSMVWQRRELVAFIKCQGFTKGVLWRWLFCESALLLGSGCLIGAVFGLYGQVLGSHVLAVVTGFPILFDVGFLVALSSFALVSVVAVGIVSFAGFLVVRVPPRTVSPAY
ncbi:MAG TPA: FtsX-like permease family protein [Solirubrobacteraceae bacterium]|nr:FtsX-like permease family protein [Solirubrobacteraceae bacterium]